MSQPSDLHKAAMEFATAAVMAQRAGDDGTALSAFRRAFELERDAAAILATEPTAEPTRSILLRSAASLAIDCREFREAERLIAIALAGNPPDEIGDELRDLYENVNFGRHLDVKGTTLGRSEVQLSLAGSAVGFGVIAADEYFPRVQTVENMILRTAERKKGLPFREGRRPTKAVREQVELYMSVPRAASFAVTLRIGRPIKQANLFDDDTDIVLEFLECVKLFTDEDRAKLKERIPENAYFRNFVQQAKRIAPDGERIKTVGFTATYGDQKTTVALRSPASQVWQPKPSPRRHSTVIKGVLMGAEKRERRNVIEIRDETSKVHTVHVPQGLMNDIVRPLWDRIVLVRGRQHRNRIVLEEIETIDEATPVG